jgi:hypothetical protein
MANKKSKLEKYKLKYEDKARKFRLSSTFGKKDPWIIRAGNATVKAVVYFFSESYRAIKTIMKEIM